MTKKRITEIVEEMLAGFLTEEGYALYHTEFVKEGRDWFLRVYLDRASGEGYIGTEDCEKVSRFLSRRLDEEDPIQQNYYLEVSSPGMDRPLLKWEHYQRYVGNEIEIRLYRGKDGTKQIRGRLAGLSEDRGITVIDGNGKEWELQLSEVAKANLAVIF